MTEEYTNEWDLYQKGVEYKTRINLFKTVEDNHRFFQGDQWHGVKAEGLPTPVFNIIKPVLRYKISTIMQNNVKVRYSCENYDDKEYDKMCRTAELLSQYGEQLWEKLKMEHLNEEALKDAAISGDGCTYFYYDGEKIRAEIIDNTTIFPSNPNLADIQEQEYIIIAFRRSVESVRREAENNGVSKEDRDRIVSDTEVEYRAGDMGKIEQDDSAMCTVLLKLWKDKKTNTVRFKKSTRDVVICDDCDTKCSLYPVAMFNWETRKNSFHGVSDVTGLIPNQLYINKIAAMVMLSTMYTAFPKMVYDENLVDNPSNKIGVAIGVNGADKPISSIIDYISPAHVSSDAFNMFERTISLTKELMGANDGALGAINPERASGKSILAVMEQSSQPLESIKRRFYNYLEDIALIWADMLHVYMKNSLTVSYTDNDGNTVSEKISGKLFDKLMLTARIDVGPATRWSELATVESLDSLLAQQYIPFEWYIELLPKNCGIPKERIAELIKNSQEQQLMQQQQQMQMQMQQAQQAPQLTEDDVLNQMTEEEKQQALKNPSLLTNKINEMIGK